MSCDSWQVVYHPHASAILRFEFGVILMLFLVSLLVGILILCLLSIFFSLNPSHRQLTFHSRIHPTYCTSSKYAVGARRLNGATKIFLIIIACVLV